MKYHRGKNLGGASKLTRVAKDSPRAAYELIALIEAKVMRLETPKLAQMEWPGLVAGTRELLEWPYIIVYKGYEDREEP